MATRNSTRASRTRQKPQKPAKPREDFPLFPHDSGKWAKKIKGSLYYFGRWEDPDGALKEYEEHQDALRNGRDTRGTPVTVLTLHIACNAFMQSRERRMLAGEMTRRSYDDYRSTCKRLLKHFGKSTLVEQLGPSDFEEYRAKLAKTRGVWALGNEVQRVRSVFKYCFENKYTDRPVDLGSEFVKPNRKTQQRHRNQTGKKTFTAAEIKLLLDEVGVHLRAMVLLGINCGFGNSDCGNLPLRAVDLDKGWIEFPRPKTAVPRRIPLWPETVEALKASLSRRPEPKAPDATDKFFVTLEGLSWAKEKALNPISKRTTAALMRLKIHRSGMSFYWLRHSFRTVADQSRDQAAIDSIMGHVGGNPMATVYRHEIDDDRLRAVTGHVRRWLFGDSLSAA